MDFTTDYHLWSASVKAFVTISQWRNATEGLVGVNFTECFASCSSLI